MSFQWEQSEVDGEHGRSPEDIASTMEREISRLRDLSDNMAYTILELKGMLGDQITADERMSLEARDQRSRGRR